MRNLIFCRFQLKLFGLLQLEVLTSTFWVASIGAWYCCGLPQKFPWAESTVSKVSTFARSWIENNECVKSIKHVKNSKMDKSTWRAKMPRKDIFLKSAGITATSSINCIFALAWLSLITIVLKLYVKKSLTAPTTSASTSGTSAPGKIVVSSRVWSIWLDENFDMFHYVLKPKAECKEKKKSSNNFSH